MLSLPLWELARPVSGWHLTLPSRVRFPHFSSQLHAELRTDNRQTFRPSGMKMAIPDIRETYSYYAAELKKRDLAYLHVVESRIAGNVTVDADESETLDFLVRPGCVSCLHRRLNAGLNSIDLVQHDIWSPKPFFVAGGFKEDSAAQEVARGENVAVVFGRYFISNVSRACLPLHSSSVETLELTPRLVDRAQPDLVKRIKHGIEFEPYNRDTFYLLGPEQTKGYTDYKNADESPYSAAEKKEVKQDESEVQP